MQPYSLPACPHCGSDQTQGHGSFPLKNGTRKPRWLCRTCGRTFCAQTGTTANYLKKRQQWEQMPRLMAEHRTVRGLARVLGVRPATVFRWRHRLLGTLCRQPQPGPASEVAIAEAFIKYSEKGSRTSIGPGAWRSRMRGPHAKPFRRFVDGKPSCVLLAYSRGQLRTLITGQGRPELLALAATLGPVLVPGATVWTSGFAVPAAACQQLGYQAPTVPPLMQAWEHPAHEANRQRGHLRWWLGEFRGVATRYLPHYLAWFRHAQQSPEAAFAA